MSFLETLQKNVMIPEKYKQMTREELENRVIEVKKTAWLTPIYSRPSLSKRRGHTVCRCNR
jgi:ABC-type sugar transport system ATPase subunit